jgi:hypothetical protein
VNERPGALLVGAVVFAVFAALSSSVTGCRRSNDTAATSSAPDAAPAASPASSAVPAPPADRWSEQGMLAEAALYLDNADFRRATLEECLTNPKNIYSRQRLEAYGLKKKGWDLLPEWTPQSVPVTTSMAADLRAHRPLAMDPNTPRLWDGKRPTTMSAWVALGREVFFGYPLRVEIFMNYALEHPDVGERVGVRAGADGVYPGVRLFTDLEGKSRLGITCAICHTGVDEKGHVLSGEARRAFDYGALRLAYHKETGVPVDADLARRMRTWGPGRADVTEDDDEDPVAIPDLWGLKHQSALTQAGTIKHVGPTALAIRQETQLLHSNHQKIRPPRELAYALALYLYSLEPDAKPATAPSKLAPHGQELFGEHCKGCHSNDALGGPPIAAERVGTAPW